MLTFQEIQINDIDNELMSSANELFSWYPQAIDISSYHRFRLNSSRNSRLFGIFSNKNIEAVVEHSEDDYDSALLGLKAGGLRNILLRNGLTENQRETIYDFALKNYSIFLQDQQYGFVFSTCSNWNGTLLNILQRYGYKYILSWGKCFTINTTDCKLPHQFEVKIIKLADDLPAILNMAKDYFKGGRFYLDPNIDNTKADQLYYDLIDNSYNNPDVSFCVLYKGKVPIGCIILNYSVLPIVGGKKLKACSVRLLVYNKTEGYKGLSELFLRRTINLLLQENDIVESGVELHNLPSMKIHLNAGFKFNYIYSAFHAWF